MYSQSTEPVRSLLFFPVKFVKFLRISANSTMACDICCTINDFIALNRQFLNIFFLNLSKIVNYACFPPGPSIANRLSRIVVTSNVLFFWECDVLNTYQ